MNNEFLNFFTKRFFQGMTHLYYNRLFSLLRQITRSLRTHVQTRKLFTCA